VNKFVVYELQVAKLLFLCCSFVAIFLSQTVSSVALAYPNAAADPAPTFGWGYGKRYARYANRRRGTNPRRESYDTHGSGRDFNNRR
jgi:hypothetical protein